MKEFFHRFMQIPIIDKIMNYWYEKGSWKYVAWLLFGILLVLNCVKLAQCYGNDFVGFMRGNIIGYEFSKDAVVTSSIYGISAFLVYLVAVAVEFGILKSISISWCYVKPHWLFQLMMWSSILTIGIIGNCNLYYIVCILFGIMTCNPSINRGNVYFIPHCVGAISAIGLSVLGSWLIFGFTIVPFLCLGSVLMIFLLSARFDWLKERKLWFIEVVSLLFAISSLICGRIL